MHEPVATQEIVAALVGCRLETVILGFEDREMAVLHACKVFEKSLAVRIPRLAGKIVIKFVIAKDGSVSSASAPPSRGKRLPSPSTIRSLGHTPSHRLARRLPSSLTRCRFQIRTVDCGSSWK